jgi:hypothetical protein
MLPTQTFILLPSTACIGLVASHSSEIFPISFTILVIGGRKIITESLNALADAICKDHPRLAENAKFLLVPGPIDAGFSAALPRRKVL